MADSGSYSPETILRHQKIADQLLMQAVKPREIRNPIQGLGQLGEAALAGWEGYRADRDEKTARNEAVAQALAAFGGGGGGQQPVVPAAAPMAAGDAPIGVPPADPVQTGSLPAPAPTSNFMPNVGGLQAPEPQGPQPFRKFSIADVAGAVSGNHPDMPSSWTDAQRARAQGVNPILLSTAARAEAAGGVPFSPGIEGGVRDQATQDRLVAAGASQTRNSNHLRGNAIDLWPNGNPNAPASQYAQVADALKGAAASGGVPINWGGDWKGGWDKPHFEMGKGAPSQVASLDPSAGVPPGAPQPPASVPAVAAALQGSAGAPAVQDGPPPPQQIAQNAPMAAAGPGRGAPNNREGIIKALMNPWVPDSVRASLLSQVSPKPQAMKITNRDGSESIVFVDPHRGTITGADGKPVDQSGAVPNPGLSGDDYLKTIPAGRRELITGMLEGRIGPAQMGRYGTKQVQALLEDAARVEPSFDMTTWKGREAGIKDFYGGGKSQETVRKANQSALHFAELFGDKADKLPGTSVPAFNAVANAVNTNLLGKDAAPNFEVNAHALADELAGLFKGAGISDTEIRAWESRISPNMSAEQQRGMARTLLGLYRDSASALEKKRQDALGPTLAGKRAPVLGPEAEAALMRVEKFSGGQNVSGDAAVATEKTISGKTYVKRGNDWFEK